MTLTEWVRANRAYVQAVAEHECPVVPWTEQRLVRFVRRNATLLMVARSHGIKIRTEAYPNTEG